MERQVIGSRYAAERLTLGDAWRAVRSWCDEPFRACRMRLGSVDRTYEDDEEDMTWVEYQWLARTNHESPRMKRPPPRLNQCLTPSKGSSNTDSCSEDDSHNEEEATSHTPPITPPLQASLPTSGGGTSPGGTSAAT